MTEPEDTGRPCVDHLLNDLLRVWSRYRDEYHITTVEFIGSLEVIKYHMLEAVADEPDLNKNA